MEILFVTTELSPYVKATELADVSAALPKTLKSLGHKVTVVIPRYPAFEHAGLLLARRLTPLHLELGGRSFDVTVYDGRLSSQVDLILLEAHGLFDQAEGDVPIDATGDATRLAVFSRAVAELVRQRQEAGSPFDAVHVNDAQTALVAKFLKDAGVRTPSVLTIHHIEKQGIFPKEKIQELGLATADFTPAGVEFFGSVNVLKQGIVSADVVTTVSPTYATEILTEQGGARLEGVLQAKGRVSGILEGIDYSIWNPATDSHLVARYDAEDTSNKVRCLGALQKELGLPLDTDAPLIVSVGPLDERHGADLVAEIVARVLRGSNAQIVVAGPHEGQGRHGSGDPEIVAKLEAAVEKSHGRAVFVRAPSDALAHRLYAAADVVLVPSRVEPSGQTQLRAQRYGALPVAHRTGGLVDTVVDCDAKLETGTGFVFDEANATSFYGAISRAIAAWSSSHWPTLRRRVMRLDRSWERTARQYEQTYKSATIAAS